MKKNLPRILVFCPARPLPPYVLPETMASLLSLRWGAPFDIVIGRDDKKVQPERDAAYDNLAGKYIHARELVLAGGYDGLLTVEADMIVPPDALEKMTAASMETTADVVYALYCSRYDFYGHNWLAVTERGTHGVQPASRDPRFRAEVWDRVVVTAGHGLGCTLIWRPVLEAVPFRRPPGSTVANDWHFALDCQELHFRQVHDGRVRCGHVDGKVIYWPDPVSTFRVTKTEGKRGR